MFKELKNGIEILVGQVVFKLQIKNCTSNQIEHAFVCYLKIIYSVLKNNICILKQIF